MDNLLHGLKVGNIVYFEHEKEKGLTSSGVIIDSAENDHTGVVVEMFHPVKGEYTTWTDEHNKMFCFTYELTVLF